MWGEATAGCTKSEGPSYYPGTNKPTTYSLAGQVVDYDSKETATPIRGKVNAGCTRSEEPSYYYGTNKPTAHSPLRYETGQNSCYYPGEKHD